MSYSVTVRELRDLMETRGTEAIERLEHDFGGIKGLCRKLKVNPNEGIGANKDDIHERRIQFGSNVIPPKPPKTWFELAFEAIQDVTLIILLVAATVSTGLSFLPKDVQAGDEDHGNIEWIEPVAIFATVLIVVVVVATNDYVKEKQFRGLQSKLEADLNFTVLREGSIREIQVGNIVVGDICHIKYGDILPADGVIVQSNDLKIDESSLTGESEQIRKAFDVDPMLLSGTNVMEGSGKMIVTAVGVNSQAGIILTLMGAVQESKDDKLRQQQEEQARKQAQKLRQRSIASRQSVPTTPTMLEERQSDARPEEEPEQVQQEQSVLRRKLTKLAIDIGYMGLGVGLLVIVVMSIRFSIQTYYVEAKTWEWIDLNNYVRFVIIGVTVLVVAVPEGLPLAVTISLAYSVKKMMDDNNLVRHLDACETMGNATTICSDKTGTLTTNRMTVVQAYICHKYFSSKLPSHDELPLNVTHLLVQGISINSSYTSKIQLNPNPNELVQQFGNKTECALLGLVNAIGHDYEFIRSQSPEDTFVRVYTFNSTRKSMSTVVRNKDRGFRLFTKGASEIILSKCSYIFNETGQVVPLRPDDYNRMMDAVIDPMASDGLRTISVAYRDFVYGNVEINEVPLEDGQIPDWDNEKNIITNLTCICIVGIEDPLRPEVPEAIRICQKAGVTVRMVTGDNPQTARSIAMKCGILRKDDVGDVVLDGKQFNQKIRGVDGEIKQELIDLLWPNLKVLARSSPTDKYNLVKGIIDSKVSANREVVAVTGDGTNDGPALKKADVGFAMGIAGTEVAKEASDIILTDDNFNSIVKALMWGRNVYDSISKFLQFQLTVNVVAIIVTIIGTCVLMSTPLKAVQMLWINLIMDTMAALALATEKPTRDLLKRKPYGRKKPLVSGIMWKNILGQSVYQIVVLFLLLFKGPEWLQIKSGIDANIHDGPTQHYTMIFNTLVMMTMFNEINSRKVHGERNVFKGVFSNPIFYSVWGVTVIVQFIIVHWGGLVFQCARLNIKLWGVCLILGAGTLLWGQLIICLPVNCARSKKRDSVPEERVEEGRRSSILMVRGTRTQNQMDPIKTFQQNVNRMSFHTNLKPNRSVDSEGLSFHTATSNGYNFAEKV